MGALIASSYGAALAAFLILFAALKIVTGTLQFVFGIVALPFGQ